MSKKSLIDSVKVESPCSEDWEKMRGNDQVRFCSHCAKHVSNLSAITRKEAARLVRSSGGNICIRYIAHPVTRRPMFGEQLIQISRRAPALAAGVMTASLSLSSMMYGQAGPALPEPASRAAASQSNERDASEPDVPATKDDPALGSIEGIILDESGNAVPDVEISIIAAGVDGYPEGQTTDANGAYKFEDLEPGTYTIRIASSTGVMKKAARGIDLAQGQKMFRNIYVRVVTAKEGEVGIGVGTGWGMGGAMAYVEYDLPLNRAVRDNSLDEVRKLLSRGENVNGKDKNYDNITPLFLAVETGSVEMVRLLLGHGADVNARDGGERTPLMFIDSDATPELIEILLSAGADVNARDSSGSYVLSDTIGTITLETLNALIRGKVDVDGADENGVTPLMKAAEDEDIEKVTALLSAGAKVNERDQGGESAWDKTSDPEVERILEVHGAVADDSAVEVLKLLVKAENVDGTPDDGPTDRDEPETGSELPDEPPVG